MQEAEKSILLKEENVEKYNVRLVLDPELITYIICSYDQTRLEVLKYAGSEEAKRDFFLIVNTIKNVLKCEGKT